ncbi:hypothetical protein CYG48_17545 (plasmid) [Neorhizobium sp. SOG26]|uniref:AraC family transcriptional regulator n=1 Tax=Neorhizobium sp. SOG26 TaxID=2060726 RepID=UPI000E597B30|nr:AraC family transcriptional regulator [Neorhizobium sp. SOG26]AXV17633.1 hypothetical protein CYG48_17545 [Neorhizobium sp. SOG26]
MSENNRAGLHQLYQGEQRHRLMLPHVEVVYAWMPPFEGASRTRKRRLEVVFSEHDHVALEQGGRTYDVSVAPGGFYVIGEEPTTLLRVPEFSDTLEIYFDEGLLAEEAECSGDLRSKFIATLDKNPRPRFTVEGNIIGIAHVLRRATLGLHHLSTMEISTIEHILARQVVGAEQPAGSAKLLSPRRLKRVMERIEDQLTAPLTLRDLAGEACLSPYHFARSFKRTVGLPPHRYVLARRLDRAKRELVTTNRTVGEIAYSLGFENLHHFRSQFRGQFGVRPHEMRQAIRGGR